MKYLIIIAAFLLGGCVDYQPMRVECFDVDGKLTHKEVLYGSISFGILNEAVDDHRYYRSKSLGHKCVVQPAGGE